MFVGRKKELEALESFYNSNKKLLCLKGQVGMGKTTLLREFAKDKKERYMRCHDLPIRLISRR